MNVGAEGIARDATSRVLDRRDGAREPPIARVGERDTSLSAVCRLNEQPLVLGIAADDAIEDYERRSRKLGGTRHKVLVADFDVALSCAPLDFVTCRSHKS